MSNVHATYEKTVFGTWLYILSDFLFFGTLFAVYAFFKGDKNTSDLFPLKWALFESILLLLSSTSAGLAGAYLHRKNRKYTLMYFFFAFVLGLSFVSIEVSNLVSLFNQGYTWKVSAFLSSYFTLIGTHAMHVIFCLFWMIVLLFPLFFQEITDRDVRRLTCFRMFWQFLNIVWIFIFTVVYLLGVEGYYG